MSRNCSFRWIPKAVAGQPLTQRTPARTPAEASLCAHGNPKPSVQGPLSVTSDLGPSQTAQHCTGLLWPGGLSLQPGSCCWVSKKDALSTAQSPAPREGRSRFSHCICSKQGPPRAQTLEARGFDNPKLEGCGAGAREQGSPALPRPHQQRGSTPPPPHTSAADKTQQTARVRGPSQPALASGQLQGHR